MNVTISRALFDQLLRQAYPLATATQLEDLARQMGVDGAEPDISHYSPFRNGVPFDDLCLGARFKYEADSGQVFVKISHRIVARWDASELATNWVGQGVYSFDENDDFETLVFVVEPSLVGRPLRQQPVQSRETSMNEIYVRFSTADSKGRFIQPFSIRVKQVKWHGMTDEGMLWDILHADSTFERILVRTERYGDFRLGECEERIVDITIVGWDGYEIGKDEFHARVGKGKFIHPDRGHFVEEHELPSDVTSSKGNDRHG